MSDSLLDASDLDPGDEKARRALGLFRIERISAPAGDTFEEAFGSLFTEFGARGELERREVIERWLSETRTLLSPDGTRSGEYFLLVARTKDGRLAGVRDVHITMDTTQRIVVAYLAHVLVLPEHRRSGLATLLRTVPLALARRAMRDAHEILLAAEMEPVTREALESRVRLVAYGRAGFSAIAPEHIAYCQPDFRAPSEIANQPNPLPLLAVVRRAGHERETTLPKALATAFLNHLYGVFATHAKPEHLAPALARSRNRLLSAPDPLPLLALPTDLDDERFAPLERSHVLPAYERKP